MKKIETSKLMVFLITLFGVMTVVVYYWLIYQGIEVDSAVAVAGIGEIIVPVIGYLIYNAKLKDSRNKYKVDKDGIPYDFYVDDEDEEEKYFDEE